jgi:hypothetical protein
MAQEKEPKQFAIYQILIEPQEEQKLAAWQVELNYSNLEIVGIAGGDEPFEKPSDYDSRGLSGGRIILATFSLAKNLRVGRQVVARVHVLEQAGAMRKSKFKIIAVANEKGERIEAKMTMVKELKK